MEILNSTECIHVPEKVSNCFECGSTLNTEMTSTVYDLVASVVSRQLQG